MGGVDTAAALLAAVGAPDALVLRRTRSGSADPAELWEHVGGTGAGAPRHPGQPLPEPHEQGPDHLLARALSTQQVVRVLSASPVAVTSTHRATTAAVVPLGSDALVVLSAPHRSDALLAATDADLRGAAQHLLAVAARDGGALGAPVAPRVLELPADQLTGSVAGPVVDELRALHAVQELTGALRRTPAEAVEKVASVLLDALGCQLAAAWLDGGPAVVVRPPSVAAGTRAHVVTPLAAATDAELLAAARTAVAGPSPVVAPLGAPLRARDGAVAALALPLGGPDQPGGPVGGVLAVRSGEGAQPFSPLRRRIATQLVQTAGTVLAVVLARQTVEQQLSDTRLQLGRDALTDVGSRHRWDSELAAAQGLVDAGVPVAVALLDLDDLKHVNDTHGHAAGDELLRTCGSALRSALRGSSDVVARVGGDEFAVLVPRVGDVDALAARLRAAVEAARTSDGLPLRVSVGAARAETGRTVAEAVTAADAAMYADKRRRRALRASG